jgi:hypothetical protein
MADANGRGLSAVLAALIETGASILSCDTETASLEDMFCSLVEEHKSPVGDAAESIR